MPEYHEEDDGVVTPEEMRQWIAMGAETTPVELGTKADFVERLIVSASNEALLQWRENKLGIVLAILFIAAVIVCIILGS